MMLQGHAVTLTFNVATQILRATRRLNMVIIYVGWFLNPTSNNKFLGRTRLSATSCCDIDLHCSHPIVARDTSSTYGDYFFLNSFKIRL